MSTEASTVRLEFPQAGLAVAMSADFTCFGVHDGCRSRRSATAPATCGAEKLVPPRIAYWSPANSSSVEEMMLSPGAAMSGLSLWPNAVSPADENAVGPPAQPVE